MTERQEQARIYQRIKNVISLVSLGITLISLVVFALTPASVSLRRGVVAAWTDNPWLVVALYFTAFSIIFFLVDLPLHVYSSFIIEHRFGLSNLTLGAWIKENAKRQIISFVFALILIELLYAVIRTFPDRWWLIAWALWIVVTIVVGKLWPVFIAPLFYKYERLPAGLLRDRIFRLVESVGLKIENVYSMNLSKTTRKANAYFCGLGRTRRVVLSDTLFRNFTPDEVTAVVAHEAGHCKRRHIWRCILFNMGASLVSFYLGRLGLEFLSPRLGIKEAADVAGFPLLALIVVLFGVLMMPVTNVFSRALEREADDFALSTTRAKDAFISCMRKLAIVNLSNPDPHPLIEFFLHSHPSIRKRIERAESSVFIS